MFRPTHSTVRLHDSRVGPIPRTTMIIKTFAACGLALALSIANAQTAPSASAATVAAATPYAPIDIANSPTLTRIKNSGYLVMSVRDTSSPFAYNNGSDQFIGYSVELCEHVVKGLMQELGLPNLKIIYLPVSGAERVPFVVEGKTDMECSTTTITKARAEQANFSFATFYSQTMFVGDKSKKLDKLEALKGTTVAVSDGTIQLKFIQDLNASQNYGIKILTYKNIQEAYLATLDGKADFTTSDDLLLVGLRNSTKDETGKMKMFDVAVMPNTYGMTLPKGDPIYLDAFNRQLKALFDSKKAEEIYAKWFTSPIPPQDKAINWPIGKTKDLFDNPTSEALLP